MIRAPVGRAPWAGPRAVSPGQRAGERAMGAHSGALYGRLHGPACGRTGGLTSAEVNVRVLLACAAT